MRRIAVALGFSLMLGGCSSEPVFTDHVAARRVYFSPSGPFLSLTYLTCKGEAIPKVSVVQTDGGHEWAWEVVLRNYFGSPRTNGTAYFLITRNHGEAFRHEDELPVEHESLLKVTIFVQGRKPLVVSDLKIADLRKGVLMLATGEEVKDLDVQEWESGKSKYQQVRGCPPD